MIRVVTYLWHDPVAKHGAAYHYTPEHVRRLYRMVKRHLTLPFTFHVITDVPETEFGEGIEAIPISRWQHVIDNMGRAYVKLSIFSLWAREHFGDAHILTLDLDMVITGSLDALAGKGLQSDFTGWKSTHSRHGSTRTYSGAMHMHKAGACRQIWDVFQLIKKIRHDGTEITGSDQCITTTVLGESRYPSWNTSDGVYDWFDVQDMNELPENACVVNISGMDRDVSLPDCPKWLREHWA